MKACLVQMVSDKKGAQAPALIYFRCVPAQDLPTCHLFAAFSLSNNALSYFQGTESEFRGLMSWKLSGKDKKEPEFTDTGKPFEDDQKDDDVARELKGLHLTWNYKAPEGHKVKRDPTKRFVIQWGDPRASEETEKECFEMLKIYFDNCCIASGPREVQWNNIKEEHDKFWNAACKVWKGHPMVTHKPHDRSK